MSGRLFVVGLATAATASIIPRNSEQECCFSITSSGGVSGTLGQLYVRGLQMRSQQNEADFS